MGQAFLVGPDHETHAPAGIAGRERKLRERRVELGLHLAHERVVVNVIDYADNRIHFRAVAATDAHAAVQRAAAREVAVGEGPVDDHRQRPSHAIPRVECTTFAQRETHRLEVSRRHDLPIAWRALVRRWRVSFDLKPPIAHLGRERQETHGTDAPNARHPGNAALELVPERGNAHRIGVPRRRCRKTHRQHSVGAEAGVDGEEIPHAADHQSSSHHEHDGQRDLGRDE